MPGPFASLNGISLVRGRIWIPFSGIWQADLVLDTQTDVSGPLVLKVADITATCRRVRSVSEVGARGIRVIGGAGGWRQKVGPRQYAPGISSAVVLADAASSPTIDDTRAVGGGLVGETVVVDSPVTLTGYVRRQGAAGQVLNDLAEGVWWMGFDGVTHVGARSTTPIVSDFTIAGITGARGQYTVATETLADWTPGRTFTSPVVSGNISEVEHRIDKGNLRTMVLSQ